jgi:uncharacterized protein (DUF362 family)
MNSVVKVSADSGIKQAIVEAVALVTDDRSGLQKFIKKGDTVLIKPNFNTADPFPASTDYDFLRAVVELTYDCGAKIVMIGESSTMSLNTRKVMEKIGVYKLEQIDIPPRIYSFDEKSWNRQTVPGARYLKHASLSEFLDRADKLILLPCLKTHFIAQYTGALKLSVGFMSPWERVKLHSSRRIQEKIAELNTLIRPDIVIMDARKCFITKGPSKGEVREPNSILASTSRVDVDIEGVKIIQSFKGNALYGINPKELPQIRHAQALGIDAQ